MEQRSRKYILTESSHNTKNIRTLLTEAKSKQVLTEASSTKMYINGREVDEKTWKAFFTIAKPVSVDGGDTTALDAYLNGEGNGKKTRVNIKANFDKGGFNLDADDNPITVQLITTQKAGLKDKIAQAKADKTTDASQQVSAKYLMELRDIGDGKFAFTVNGKNVISYPSIDAAYQSFNNLKKGFEAKGYKD